MERVAANPARHGLPHMLRGRGGECATLDGLLEGVRGGRSAALVVRGEAGVGKTALLRYAVESATDMRVVRAVGVESEMELAFAALHQLCGPLLDRLGHLPDPQRDALGTAFGLIAGPAPDRFLVGLAVLSLLSEAAEERPLIWVVDDAQWLDRASAQVLAFAARRLLAESVLILFATREADADARELLAQVVRWPLDERVRDRIVAETGGNPLALLELPRGAVTGRAGRGLRRPGCAAAVRPDRGQLPAPDQRPARVGPALAAGRGRGADWRPGPGVEGRDAARPGHRRRR